MTGLCESGDDSRALGRLRIFSRETNDYTIRAEQMRPDVRELLDRIEALEAHIREHITFAETRIKDGTELGATVWRIALEDIARESRALLSEHPQ